MTNRLRPYFLSLAMSAEEMTRTKTFKLVDQPTVDELTTEVTLLEQWLPLMVTVDKNFDINLEVSRKRELSTMECVFSASAVTPCNSGPKGWPQIDSVVPRRLGQSHLLLTVSCDGTYLSGRVQYRLTWQ